MFLLEEIKTIYCLTGYATGWQNKKNMLAILVLFDFQLQTAVGISVICSFMQALHLKFSFFHLISFNSQHMFCSDLLQSKTHVVVFFFYQETTAPCAGREVRYKTEKKTWGISAGRHVDDGARQSLKKRSLLTIVPVSVL